MIIKILLFTTIFSLSVFLASAQDTVLLDKIDTVSTSPTSSEPEIKAGSPQLQQTVYKRPSPAARRSAYLKGTFGPLALGRNAASAGFSTWRNTPKEWGGQWEGFGKRFASNTGKRVIGNTVRFGLEEALELDSSFYRSTNRSFGSKIKNALLSTVTARKANGKRVIGVPRLVGTYSSHIIAAETWYPDRYDYKDGLKSGTISFGTGALFNLFREFVSR